MVVVEENWRTKCSAITERTTFILLLFNSELLSDVKVVVPAASTTESDSNQCLQSAVFCCIPCSLVKWQILKKILLNYLTAVGTRVF